ncbi:MAG: 30S ribosomal protein S13 [Microgenomates group bacterium ADurb.Bin238]|jgi:small subunit ribosomal protein S13|nr:MAG: 30S ribosomal protein S13 [Microgenomates group bacterium ADurb.Bin238]
MPRIAGVDIPNDKPIKISLTYIYGVGHATASKILSELKINPDLKANKLTSSQIQSIANWLDRLPTEGDLKKIVRDNIQRLKRIGSYRGLRHMAGLPSRGQRTRTNGRSIRGRRKTIGAMTKEMRQKMETVTSTK